MMGILRAECVALDPQYWNAVERLFHTAQSLSPPERHEFLHTRCGSDVRLVSEVQALLAASDHETFLIEPFYGGARSLLHGKHSEHSALPSDAEVDGYRLVRSLAVSATSEVYLAEKDEQQFALKFLRVGSMNTWRRFRAEQIILAQLDHPHIARFIEAGMTPAGRLYLVLEYVDGCAIDAYCSQSAPELHDLLELFCKVCAAVEFAHEHLVVHCDLKPSNIVVGPSAEPKVLDFGIAKMLPFGEVSGLTQSTYPPLTLRYASPEQVLGRPVTVRTDVYALGILLYELLCGTNPFGSIESPMELVRYICEHEVPRPSAVSHRHSTKTDARTTQHTGPLGRRLNGRRKELDWIVLRAIQKDPRHRYPSAREFANDIDRFVKGLPLVARRPTAFYLLRKFVARHRTASLLAMATICCLMLGVAGVTLGYVRAREERQRAMVARHDTSAVLAFLEEILASSDNRTQGRERTVREVADRASAQLESSTEYRPGVRADLHRRLAHIYSSLTLYDQAVSHLRDAVAIRRELQDSQPLELADALCELAKGLHEVGLLEEALNCSEDAIARYQSQTATPPACLWRALHTKGLVLLRLLRPQEARRVLEEALAHSRELKNEAIPVAETRSTLGLALLDCGDETAAENDFRDAIATFREFGDRRNELITTGCLAKLLTFRNEWREATQLLEDVLERQRDLLGEQHLDIARTLSNLAVVAIKAGRHDEGLHLIESARNMLAHLGLRDNIDLLYNYANLAAVLRVSNRPEEAEGAYRDALRLASKLLPREHPMSALLHTRFGELCLEFGRFNEAEEHFEIASNAYVSGTACRPLLREHALLQLATARLRLGKVGDGHSIILDVAGELARIDGDWIDRLLDMVLAPVKILIDQQDFELARIILERCRSILSGRLCEDADEIATIDRTMAALDNSWREASRR